ncbi:MlaD family protein [Prochlorococcus marinus]|uniref:Possible ABC transporter n=1 Tax=Prochlorococcus marinus (strain MIT 9211) TaxID=93059 RepID=A9BDT6_PROM4|nr:MlaD family protein [Prochlorococcus marinus]ABX08246.1 possible ABC transporter [Prochlorococcus marinus str. MIT 9211]
MRRSYREAIVGFTLLGGVVLLSGIIIWLQGFRVGRNDWNIVATFDDASGLSDGTPVTFRGIKVGSVEKISFNTRNVKANLRLNTNKLLLFKPVYAKVLASSVLGRDMEVSLISKGVHSQNITSLPNKKDCPSNLIVCDGDTIKGQAIKNISTLTEELNELLDQAGEEEVISKMVKSIGQFDETQQELKELIELSKEEMIRAKPIITELKKTVAHINNILAVVDNPETLGHIKQTAKSMSSTTQKLDKLATDLSKMINNEELTSAIQSAAIGIGKLFNDLYP